MVHFLFDPVRSSSPTTPQWTQIGIFGFGAQNHFFSLIEMGSCDIAFSIGFHDSDYLGVYTRVMSFRDWSKEHANV